MNSTQETQPTNAEILDAINEYASRIEGDISSLKSDVGSLKDDVGSLKGDMSSLKTDMSSLKSEVIAMKALMVTKDYLDDKLADLRGDILTVIRKEDRRVTTLVEILQEKNVLSRDEALKLQAMQPLIPTHG